MRFIQDKAIPIVCAHLKAYHQVQNHLGVHHTESLAVVEQLTLELLSGGHASCLDKGAPHFYLNSAVGDVLQFLIHPVSHKIQVYLSRFTLLSDS